MRFPKKLKDIILPADMEDQKALSSLLREETVERLGLEQAVTLIKAPANQETLPYWLRCVEYLSEGKPLPLPQSLSQSHLPLGDSLLKAENAVGQCDIYLWLAHRLDAVSTYPKMEEVLKQKWSLIDKIEKNVEF